MKMNFPPEIKIGAHRYKVIFPYAFRERGDLSGQADHAMNEIRVCAINEGGNVKPDSAVKVTMLHELVHCVDVVSGQQALNDGSKEHEAIVEGIAQGLLQVFTDNPELTKSLFEVHHAV